MRAPKDKTLVKIDLEGKIEFLQDDGNAYHTKVLDSGIILASAYVRDKASRFDPRHGVVLTGEHKGKTAWFDKNSYKEAKSYGNINHLLKSEDIGEPEGTYLLLETANIFFYTVDGAVEMVKEWCLCEPIGDVDWEYVDGVRIKVRTSTGGIIIPVQEEDYKTGQAIIRHIHPEISEELGINAGDTVYLDKACDLPLEDELNTKLDRKYFRVEVCNILGKEESPKPFCQTIPQPARALPNSMASE